MDIRRWVRSAAVRLGLPKGTINVVFVRPAESAIVNRRYRGRLGPTNILSFAYHPSIGEVIGELIVCPQVARHQSGHGDYQSHLRFLIEHGCIHLLGIDHTTRSEQQRWIQYERKLSQ